MPKRHPVASDRVPPEWGEIGGPFPRFALTDDEWIRIADVAGIHPGNPEIRQAFDDVIAHYRRREVNDAEIPSAAITRDQLRELGRHSLELRNSLVRCIENVDACFALDLARPFHRGQLQSENDRPLETLVTELEELANLAASASPYVDATKRGPKAHNLYLLVAEADAIRERLTGLLLRRSSYSHYPSKDYVQLLCRIADPSVGPGAIDIAMRHRIKHRRPAAP